MRQLTCINQTFHWWASGWMEGMNEMVKLMKVRVKVTDKRKKYKQIKRRNIMILRKGRKERKEGTKEG